MLVYYNRFLLQLQLLVVFFILICGCYFFKTYFLLLFDICSLLKFWVLLLVILITIVDNYCWMKLFIFIFNICFETISYMLRVFENYTAWSLERTASVFFTKTIFLVAPCNSYIFLWSKRNENFISFRVSFILFLRYNFIYLFFFSFTVNRYNRSIFHKIHIMPYIIYLSQYYKLN